MTLRSILVTGLVCFGVVGARADWTKVQRTEFVKDCTDGCAKNDKVSGRHKKNCPTFCQCFLTDSEKLFPDYAQLEREINTDSELKRKFLAIAPACNKRAFRN